MKKLRLSIAALLTTVFAFGGVLAMTAPASALFEGSKDQACNGAGLQDGGGCASTTDESNRVSDILKAVLNILSLVVGVVAVIMLIIGGIRFITSQGEGSSTALARNTVIYALVGIVIVVMAQFLVQFVIGRATKGDTSGPPVSVVTNADGSKTEKTTAANGTTTTTTTSSDGKTTSKVVVQKDGTTTITTCKDGTCSAPVVTK